MAGTWTPRKQRSIEGIRAKRESLEKKRYIGAESGDDEDEELGTMQTRARSPQGARRTARSGSKLGTEMMRTNSRGSVVSGTEEILQEAEKECEACAAVGASTSAPIAIAGGGCIDDTGGRQHIGEEVLGTLPEGTELEESYTSQSPPASSGQPQNPEPAGQLGQKEEIEQGAAPLADLANTPSHSPPASQSEPHLSSESQCETQKGNLTPPTLFPTNSATPAQHQGSKDLLLSESEGDTEVTPKPSTSSANIASSVLAVDAESEPTPRASDRDRSRTRDRMLEWIRR
jgi:serine/threonine-protein kinase RIM15